MENETDGSFDRKVDTIVKATMLRNRTEHGLMVGRGVDAEHPVDTRRETLVQRSRQRTLPIQRYGQAREEGKLGRVRIVERRDRLNDQMRMSDHDTLVVDFSRRSVCVLVKRTRL